MSTMATSNTTASGSSGSSSGKRTVGVSLKMYFSHSQTQSYIQSCLPLASLASSTANPVTLFLIPDFLSLTTAATILNSDSNSNSKSNSSPILLGAQDCYHEDFGAFTGEVSPSVLRTIGCTIVELGHAERRRLFHEDDALVAKKAAAAVRNGLIPLVCVGEKTRSLDGVAQAVEECRSQVESILDVTSEGDEVIFAYEPVWAIGQAEPADPAYVVSVTRELRRICEERGRGGDVRILYGGSAGPGTFERINDGVDGLFLGRFAHDVENLRRVVEEVGGV